ncbi:MAG TPA: Xaa-Pro peptidase family protein [Actinomycetota bacterium]|nr:Xaa-Pro peptidase family protein [Actinomycetota bacterium]
MNHQSRRDRLRLRLGELGVEAFLATSNPNVRYLTGFTGSNGQVLVSWGRDVFLTDGRYETQASREVEGADRRVYLAEFAPALAEACAGLGARRVAFEATDVTVARYEDLSAVCDLVPTRGEVEALRRTKDEDELRRIREAQAISDAAFGQVLERVRAGVTERELAVDLESTMRGLGADDRAFETIVAFGSSAAEPHHAPTDRALEAGDVVKMDFGALAAGYHADMTRTVFLGRPSGELREVYELVRTAQQAGIDAMRGGATEGAVDAAARGPIEEAGFGPAFPHGLGHGVGLEIHERPFLRRGGTDTVPEGAVVTVEPGIYLEGVGGVRIEDMVEVGEDGPRPLPTSPKELIVL